MLYGHEENLTIARRFYEEVLNGKNLGAAEEFFAPDHGASLGQGPGLEGFRRSVANLLAAFPDLAVTVEDEVAAATRWLFAGPTGAPTGASCSGSPRRVER